MRKTELNQWVLVNGDNVLIKTYEGIRDDIIKDYKELNNIQELGEYSAEYIFLSNLALKIWNNNRQIKNIFQQHNFYEASGGMLDKIMGVYGVFRDEKDKLRVYLKVKQLELHKFIKEEENIRNFYFGSYDDITLKYKHHFKIEEGATYYIICLEAPLRATLSALKSGFFSVINKETNEVLGYLKEMRILNDPYYTGRESDKDFKNRINEDTTLSNLRFKLLEHPAIAKCSIFTTGDDISFLNIANNIIKPGQFLIVFKYINELEEIKRQNQNEAFFKSLNSELVNIIKQNTPLGFSTLNDTFLSNYVEKIEVELSKKSNIVRKKVTLFHYKYNFEKLSFTTRGVNLNDILKRCEELKQSDNRKKEYKVISFSNMYSLILRHFQDIKNNDIIFIQAKENAAKKKTINLKNFKNGDYDNEVITPFNFNWYQVRDKLNGEFEIAFYENNQQEVEKIIEQKTEEA